MKITLDLSEREIHYLLNDNLNIRLDEYEVAKFEEKIANAILLEKRSRRSKSTA